MAITVPRKPAEFATVTVREAANADSGRIPVTRKLVIDAVEEVMLGEDRPSFRPGGALEEAGDLNNAPRNISAGDTENREAAPADD